MRTLILTCNTGEGHNSTAKAILEAYDLYGEFCEIRETFSFLSNRLSRIIGKGHATMYRHTPRVFDKGYALSEKHDSAFASGSPLHRFLAYGTKKLHRYVVSNDIDNIICVHPFSAMLAYNLCEKYNMSSIQLSIVATDYTCAPGTNSADLDKYFIPHKDVTDSFIRCGIPKNKLYVSGIPVKGCFYIRPDKKRARESLGLPSEKKIIVMCCGSMGCGPIEHIGRSVAERLSDDEIFIIICGSNKKLYNRLSDLNGGNVQIVGFTRQMNDYLAACDLFVTKPGGLSITEGANLRVPMLFVNAVAGCELRNREFFESIECAFTSKNADDAVEKCLSIIRDQDALDRVRHQLDENFNMTGAKYIYDVLKNK